MLKRRLNRLMAKGYEMNSADLTADERFTLRTCIGYAKRHMIRFPLMDQELMTFICWLLAEKAPFLGDVFLSTSERDRYLVLVEDLENGSQDPDDYGAAYQSAYRSAPPTVKRRFQRRCRQLLDERQRLAGHRGRAPCQNVMRALARLFDLTPVEIDICVMLWITQCFYAVQTYIDYHLDGFKFRGRKYIANMIGASPTDVHRAGDRLMRCGILELINHEFSMKEEFVNYLQRPNARGLASEFYRPAPSSRLPLSAHFIPEHKLAHLKRLLGRDAGVPIHLLFHGPPGTGKTSLARRLGQEMGHRSVEVAACETNSAASRRAAITAATNMSRHGGDPVIIVDEADNLLNTHTPWLVQGETQDKGWLNQMLETPGLRMIWIANAIDLMDDAVVRRFSYSIRFHPLNRRQRISMWDTVLRRHRVKRHFPHDRISELAETYDVSAGVAATAVQTAATAGHERAHGLRRAVAIGLDAYLERRTVKRTRDERMRVAPAFTLEGLNADTDIAALVDQADRYGRRLAAEERRPRHPMSLLLYGPPGTGKSELARFIGQRLDREVIFKRYSDLQSMFVGEGEKRIRDAFDAAQRDRAVLIIDEVDAMLFRRDRAAHSWEMTFTNEFLTAVERFRSLLICTTNRIADLDAAAIRRFTHKVHIDYLTPEGNGIFYQRLLRPLAKTPLSDKEAARIKAIDGLAPGDFSTVANRFAFLPAGKITHPRLIAALEEEVRVKGLNRPRRVIGFSSPGRRNPS